MSDVTKDDVTADDVKWVVNNYGELGVCVKGKYFFLYKGHSLQYGVKPDDVSDGFVLGDDGKPMMVRPVGKREFGETCKSLERTMYDSVYAWERMRNPYFHGLAPNPCLAGVEGEWEKLPAAL